MTRLLLRGKRDKLGIVNLKKNLNNLNNLWRKCMGIEPTCRPLSRHTGFEVREPHQ